MTNEERNDRWAALLVDQWCRSGVRYVFLSPGSRSTPLTAAVARRGDLRVIVHVDERAAAFAALGASRADGRPALWLTTSGTAAANGLPAVVEASQDRVPLLLATADRPPELRDTGANQAIDQVRLFGSYVRWQADLPCPDPAIPDDYVRSTAAQALHMANHVPAGPVHLNCMFREPLGPLPLSAEPPVDDPRAVPHAVAVPPVPAPSPFTLRALRRLVEPVRRGLIVAGTLSNDAEQDAVLRLAKLLRWPLLPDITSGLRLGSDGKQTAAAYDALLPAALDASDFRPELVLHAGGRVVSKRLLQALDTWRAPYVRLQRHPGRDDPTHRTTLRVEGELAWVADAAAQGWTFNSDADWHAGWVGASAMVEAALDHRLERDGDLSEPWIARAVSRSLPVNGALFLGSSLPIRAFDRFAASDGAGVPVAANRGASGIDGTVASAAGACLAWARPTVAVLGDLALLHDLNALLLVARERLPLTLVVINNNGGGIFSFLPVAARSDLFEPYFATPHNLTFEHAAGLFGLPYRCPADRGAFTEALENGLRSEAPCLIEATTDRASTHEAFTALDEVAAAAFRKRRCLP